MNPMDLLKNFQNIQSRMGEMQEQMKAVVVTGTSGGGMVSIGMNGQMEITGVKISPEAVDPEDIEMLQDLVFAAFADASAKIKEKMREEMSKLTGGIDIPPGLFGM
jgi:DNA-binding YbaB/EbfC family protein